MDQLTKLQCAKLISMCGSFPGTKSRLHGGNKQSLRQRQSNIVKDGENTFKFTRIGTTSTHVPDLLL